MSKIEWTDKTWNPVTGCTKVSQGCKNCYAERIYERFNGHGSFKNIICHHNRLGHPLKWKKPSMIFVNSMSDLFHEDVPFEFIDHVFDNMYASNWHIFQVLTKRPERMLAFYEWKQAGNGFKFGDHWPLKNVWIGVSVEDQEAADERIPLLLKVPAAVRFLSCEPLLGEIDLGRDVIFLKKLHWVIVGGESGSGARPMHPDWVISLRDQCKVADISFFFKQWGEFWPGEKGRLYRGNMLDYTDGQTMVRTGKKKAGRLLDGKVYNEFPIT